MTQAKPKPAWPYPNAERAFDMVTSAGFLSPEQALYALRGARLAIKKGNADLDSRTSSTTWADRLRSWADCGWLRIELQTKHWWPPPNVDIEFKGRGKKRKPCITISRAVPTREAARDCAVEFLLAEHRSEDKYVRKAVKWLEENPKWWEGRQVAGPEAAYRKLNPMNAFDWYVALIITLNVRMGVIVLGFEPHEERRSGRSD